jgi:quaternary ammonium compound-resistance protein SugE
MSSVKPVEYIVSPSLDSESGDGRRWVTLRAWLILLAAAGFEIAFVLSADQSRGFTVLVPSLIVAFTAMGGTFLFSTALKDIDVGVGYTVWTGIGSVGTATLGWLLFGESLTMVKCLCFTAIIGGVVGLKLNSSSTRGT